MAYCGGKPDERPLPSAILAPNLSPSKAPRAQLKRETQRSQPQAMDTQQRLNKAIQIREALSSLMSDEESETYGFMFDHLEDYIRDLGLDHGVRLPPL